MEIGEATVTKRIYKPIPDRNRLNAVLEEAYMHQCMGNTQVGLADRSVLHKPTHQHFYDIVKKKKPKKPKQTNFVILEGGLLKIIWNSNILAQQNSFRIGSVKVSI